MAEIASMAVDTGDGDAAVADAVSLQAPILVDTTFTHAVSYAIHTTFMVEDVVLVHAVVDHAEDLVTVVDTGNSPIIFTNTS